ncbi:hypothetical protein D3C81_2154060 [compost metagenome]
MSAFWSSSVRIHSAAGNDPPAGRRTRIGMVLMKMPIVCCACAMSVGRPATVTP